MSRRQLALLVATALLGTLAQPAFAAGIATDDAYSVDEDAALAVGAPAGVLINDVPATLVTAELVTGPTHEATFSLSPDGSFAYTPEPNFHGTDSFTYLTRDVLNDPSNTATVTIAVQAVNDAPVALDSPTDACPNDDYGGSFPIPEDWGEFTFLPGSCGLKATDIDGDPLTYELVDGPSHGDGDVLSQGFASYTADANYSTPEGDWLSDSLTYTANDGTTDSNVATLRIWIAPVNDPPTFTPGPDLVTVNQGSGAYSASWATDIEPGPANEDDQDVAFVVDVRPEDEHAFSVLPQISGTGVLTFTPAVGETWLSDVTVYAQDDGGLETYPNVTVDPDDTSDAVEFEIAIGTVNDTPVASGQSVSATEDVTKAIELTATDADGDPITFTPSDPAHGTVTLGVKSCLGTPSSCTQAVTYAPNPNYFGNDSFTYTVSDGNGGTDTATVNVTIAGVNDPPLFGRAWRLSVLEDSGPGLFRVRTVMSAGPGESAQTLTLAVVGNSNPSLFSSQPSVARTSYGLRVAFTPATNRNGWASITVRLSDGLLFIDRTFRVRVVPVNDPPNAVNDLSFRVKRNAAATPLAVLANDTVAPDSGETLTITARTNGSHGTVAITGGGTGLTYKPATGFSGTDSFTYTISDGNGGFDTATVVVTVVP